MSGSKIMVLKMREIIKTLVFAVIGIILILLLLYFFIPKNSPEQEPEISYNPGTYSAVVSLNIGDIEVAVTVSENQIVDIELMEISDAHNLFYPLLKPTMEHLKADILESQSTGIQISTENEFTGQILLNAVNEAIATAKIQ